MRPDAHLRLRQVGDIYTLRNDAGLRPQRRVAGGAAGRLYGMRGGAREILISPVKGSPSSRIENRA
jgi:hypothetical protein